jgi:Zn-finger nucleic acid-binding protein
MSDRQGIEIDYCPQCRGVWLDRGELDKIIERSATYDAGPAPEPRREERRERDERRPEEPKKKKKSSFFTDLIEGLGEG